MNEGKFLVNQFVGTEGTQPDLVMPLRLAGQVGGQVDIWSVSLEQTTVRIAELWATLSDRERKVCDKLLPSDVNRFIASRGILREVLASYIQSDASDVPITENRYGKPELAGGSLFGFSVSHSEAAVVYAVSNAGCVGIDIEHTRVSLSEVAPLLGDGFTITSELPTREILFNWTCREAIFKAAGSPDSRFCDIDLSEGRSRFCGRVFTIVRLEWAGFVGAMATTAALGGELEMRLEGCPKSTSAPRVCASFAIPEELLN